MAFKRGKPAAPVPAPSKTSTAWCPKCMTKRYAAGGRCLHCGGKVQA